MELVGVPQPESPETVAQGQRTAQELARRIADDHRKALSARRHRDLLSEKFLLWIDGEGDNQRADIYDGMRVAIPRMKNEYWINENLLRPIVDNQVAYHTTMPLRYIVETRADAEARQRAVIDAAIANFIARTQRVNALMSSAMYLADATGFCPVHAFWRNDIGYDPYEPLYTNGEEYNASLQKGLIDCWVGNPFDTTFNSGARRNSVQAIRYGRVLPAEQVRRHFGIEIEGSTKLSSASIFQRIGKQWTNLFGLQRHGTPFIEGAESNEELLALICEEVPPGIEADFPEGRLSVIALPGVADTRRDGQRTSSAVHLTTQALPAGRFSSVNVYSQHRFDDIHGGAWVGPIADLQQQLNILRSKKREFIERMVRAPTLYSGDLNDDETTYDGYTMLGVQANTGANFQPKVMEIPSSVVTALDSEINAIRNQMYTIGGYQAASRGESDAGDPASKVIFLAQADDTIHGPTNVVYRNTCEDYAQLWWSLFKTYGDVPWLIDAVGDEWDELPEQYVDSSMLSDKPPQYRVTSGYGATPETKGRQIMTMVQLKGADGHPFMSTDEGRKQWPDGSLFDARSDPMAAQRRHARQTAKRLRKLGQDYRQQSGIQEVGYSDPAVQEAGLVVVNLANQQFPVLPTDDPAANMDALKEISQDDSEDPIVRVAALYRYQQYEQWVQMLQMQQAQATGVQTQAAAPPQASGGGKPVPQETPEQIAQSQGGAAAMDAREEQGTQQLAP